VVTEQITILCVDDETIILKSLNRLLRSANYNVLLAESGPKALEILEAQHVDLLIVDQRMPFMTGSDFLRIAHSKLPGVVSIMLSGYSDFDSLVAAVNYGEIFRFVAKPWDNATLLQVVTAALDGRKSKQLAEDIIQGINSLANEVKDVRIETTPTHSGVNVRVMEGGRIFTEKVILALLNNVFDTLGVSQDERIMKVSGMVTQNKGKVILFINVGQGIMMNIEMPVETI